MSPPLRPPDPNEVEVSLFGPGVGESLAIHTGDGRWVLVDSCRDRDGTNATLRYLDRIGVDPAASVDWVIATHAHNDHVNGLAEIVRTCTSARLVLPAASTAAEFLSLVGMDHGLVGYGVATRVYSEFYDVMQIVLNRTPTREVYYASAGQVLPPGASLPSSGASMRMTTLAPSPRAELQSRRFFAAVMSSCRKVTEVRQIAKRDPNSYSLGLLLDIHGVQVLLGGDVLNGVSPDTGWRYVCANFPPQHVDVHKVPHHGSAGAFAEDIWSDWLQVGSVSILTAYWPSRLPNDASITRMASYGHKLYATSRTISSAEPRKAQRVAAALSGISRSVRSARGVLGHVRVRLQPGNSAVVTLVPPALELA
jgi:beta-lactamase superfamily II metal-dependent hydrolase